VNRLLPRTARFFRCVTCARPTRRLPRTARTSAFAAAIVARHDSGTVRPPGLERTMRQRSWPIVAVQRHNHAGVLHFSPRIAITLMPTVRTRSAQEPLLPWRADKKAAQSPRTEARQAALRRILAREQRVRPGVAPQDILREALGAAPAAQERTVQRPRFKPVEMASRRLPSAPKPERAAPDVAPERKYVERDEPLVRLRPIPVPASLTATELGRVTDHVVRALDRRLVAQHERRGRF
jgi:hypothetical protein